MRHRPPSVTSRMGIALLDRVTARGAGEYFVNKRFLTTLVAGGLMAAMTPGVAVGQTESAEGTTTFTTNVTCEVGQGSPLSLPACEVDEATGVGTLTLLNPASRTGTFEGVEIFDGEVALNLATGEFSHSGLVLFSGTVEGCGAGTVFFDTSGEGTHDADGVATFTSKLYTVVPGGTLPIEGTLDESGTEVMNGDGTATQGYIGTYTCDAS
jgi:hypothetical protein